MSFTKNMIGLARTGGKAKEGRPTRFTKTGTLYSDNRPKPGEKQHDERMLDGLRELAAVWGNKA